MLGVVLAADYFAFRLFGLNYFHWYLASGPLIQLVLTGIAVAVDLEREPRLISANPAEFFGGCLALIVPLMLTPLAIGEPDWGKVGKARDDTRKEDVLRDGHSTTFSAISSTSSSLSSASPG